MNQQKGAWQVSLLMGILFLHFSQPANGQDSSLKSAHSSQCENAQTTAAMRTCENIRYEKANEHMLVAYQNLLKKLKDPEKLKLRQAQTAWLKYRDAEGDSEATAAEGGTLAPLIRTSVMADLTELRTRQLLKIAGDHTKLPPEPLTN